MSNAVMETIERIEEELATLKTIVVASNIEQPEDEDRRVWVEKMNRRRNLLRHIHEQGGKVESKDVWKELGIKFGFDTRGLGGFFVGKNSSMEKIDGEYYITGKGLRVAKSELIEY